MKQAKTRPFRANVVHTVSGGPARCISRRRSDERITGRTKWPWEEAQGHLFTQYSEVEIEIDSSAMEQIEMAKAL